MPRKRSNVRRVLDAASKPATRARGSSDAKLSPKMRDKVDTAFDDLATSLRGSPPDPGIDQETTPVPRRSAMERTADDYEAEIARYREALEPFAKMAGKPSTWALDISDARTAQLALNLGKIRRPAPTRFVSCGVRATVEGEHRIGAEVCGHMFERVEVHVTQDDIRCRGFMPWLVNIQCRVRDPHSVIALHVYPRSGCDPHIRGYAHTADEVRLKKAIASMPGGGSYTSLYRKGCAVGHHGAQMVPVEAASVADYLEELRDVREVELAEHGVVKKRLGRVESDLAAVARVFGGAKTAEDHEVPE